MILPTHSGKSVALSHFSKSDLGHPRSASGYHSLGRQFSKLQLASQIPAMKAEIRHFPKKKTKRPALLHRLKKFFHGRCLFTNLVADKFCRFLEFSLIHAWFIG